MKKRIAIIGAGFTGLSAGYYLSRNKDFEIIILEKNNNAGGLASGFKIENSSLEKAYHHIFRSDTYVEQFAKDLGINDFFIWRKSSVGIYCDKKIYDFMTPFDLLKFRPLSFFNRLRAGFVAFILKITRNYKIFLKYSAHDWLLKWGGKEVFLKLWEPLLKGKFDIYYDKISMAWLWARVHVRTNSKKSVFSDEELGYPDSGFNTLVDKTLEYFDYAGVEIYFKQDINNISSTNDGKFIINSSFATYECDVVLSTVPSNVTANFLINHSSCLDYVSNLNKINYLSAVVAVFSSDQDISSHYWTTIVEKDSPFLVFINHTKLMDRKMYNGKNIYYIGTYVSKEHRFMNIGQEELFNEWFSYLKSIFSDFDRSSIRQKNLFRFNNAQHVASVGYEKDIPAYETGLPGFYMANFSQIFPEDRGVNYAVRDGAMMSEKIIKYLASN